MKHPIRTCLAFTACCVLASNAHAALVTFVFEGVVDTEVPTELAGTFSIGDLYRLEYTFESTTPDVTADIRFGHYPLAITALSVTVGTYSATALGGDIQVVNDDSGFSDNYRIDIRDNSMSGAPINGLALDSNQLPVMVLHDTSRSVFASDALPLTPPDPTNFDLTGFNLRFSAGDINAVLHGSIVSIGAMSPDVDIDIKPGSDPNSINPRSKGKIPVAILTTNTASGESINFDAVQVDPLSVEFGPDGATEAHRRGHVEDVDGDGDMDLVLHFKNKQTGISCGDTDASLTGETFAGDAIEGSDSVNTVGCK